MFGKPYDRCGNQRHDSGAYPTEHRFHGRKRLVSGEKHRNQQNNNDGQPQQQAPVQQNNENVNIGELQDFDLFNDDGVPF